MKRNRRGHVRSNSFNITSLSYYVLHNRSRSHSSPPLSASESQRSSSNNSSNNDNDILRRRNSVHELPSQLEYQIDQKMKRRLRRMKMEDDDDNNNIDTAAGRREKSATKIIYMQMQLTEEIGAKGGNNYAEECANDNNIGRESKEATKSHQVEKEQHNGASNCGQSVTSDEETSRLQHENVTFALEQFTFENDEDGESNCSSNDHKEVDTTNNKCQMNTSSVLQRRATDCSEDTLLVRNISGGREEVVDYDHHDHVRVDQCNKMEDIDWEGTGGKRNVRRGLILEMVGEENDDDMKGDTTANNGGLYERNNSGEEGNNNDRSRNKIESDEEIHTRTIRRGGTTTAATATVKTSTSSTPTSSQINISSSSSDNNKMDMLTEGQYFLSISMLVYMYSHLRETCRMGHTRVKMEDIDCNRNSSVVQQYRRWSSGSGSGRRLFNSSLISVGGSMDDSFRSMESIEDWEHSLQQQQPQPSTSYLSSNNTLTAGSIIRIVIDELENNDKDEANMDYYGYDHQREYEESVMTQFRQWIKDSRISQLDAKTQEMITVMRKKVAKARWKRAFNATRLSNLYRQSSRKVSGMDENDDGDETEDCKKNPNTEQMIHYLRRQAARYRWKRAIAKVRLAVRLGHRTSPPTTPNFDFSVSKAGGNQYVSMDDLLRKALETQPKYFTDGSVMSNLIESSLEFVWFSDSTQNDVVYGICVQREEKKITVVFRGTVNAHNWSMNLRYDMMEIRNPVDDYYPGRAKTLNLHCGFALYLLRRRKDSRRSKMDEIFEKIEQLGKELAPDGDYKLCITGHSMGGALATLLGFFVGAKFRHSQETRNKEVQVYTFASPRVGGPAFLYAYQHLERAGLIRHARFSCIDDIVPLIPFCNFRADNLKFYKHVGMRVQLHNTGPLGKWRLRKRLDVSYPLFHDWSSTVKRGFMNCILAHPNTPRGYSTLHNLTEYQTRLHFALAYRKALASTVFFSDQNLRHLKSLDEYYAIRGTMIIDQNPDDLPSTVGINIRRRLNNVFLVIPLMYMWTRLLSVVTSAEIITPKIVHWVLMDQAPKVLTAIPFLLILQNLLSLSLGLTFIIEVIKLAIKIPNVRWGRFKKMFGRLILAAPLLNVWAKYIIRLTNAVIPKNAHRLIQQGLFELYKLVPFFAGPLYRLLQLSFGLSFVVVALGILIRTRNSRLGRNLGKILIATLMFVAWAFLFSAAYKNMASDTTSGVSKSSMPSWGLGIDNVHRVESHNNISLSALNVDEKVSNVPNTDAKKESRIASIQKQLRPLRDYATGIEFDPTLDNNGLYLVGAGVRKKSVIKVYAVAMYSTPKVLLQATSHASLHDAARTFDSSSTSSMTSFVLEMVYSAGAEKIAGAIAESVKPRYDGAAVDIGALESLIVDGVNGIGGQAIKGTIFRFDCSGEGVSVSVNGAEQGMAAFNGLGSAFVDVFMDGNSVSPTLKESCIKTWSTGENKSTAASLVELARFVGEADPEGSTETKPDKVAIRRDLEAQLKPIQEYATSVVFDAKLEEGLYLIGAGVRKKSVIKVYAVALYSSAFVLNSASSAAALRDAARSFGPSTPSTSFVLEMVYSASAEKIGGAIADSVKPRYSGSADDIRTLESLIIEGVNKKGGQASKGTTFRFDCSEEGVTVTVDGSVQGVAEFAGMGSAFVDVFLDDNAVSPTLVSSCMDTWSNPQSKATAASLLELDELEDDVSTDEQVSSEDTNQGPSLEEVESQLSPIQEYATSIVFAPTLDNNGLYLVGAGVRKKSVIKVYAVAMYSTPKVLVQATSHASLHDAARTFDSTSSSSMTSFVLEMVYSAGAEKIAGAIAESVKPRYNGAAVDIGALESLIVEGVNAIGGQAIKGTIFRFDCSGEGVSVSVNGVEQGMAAFDGLGSAFVDVFMDGNSVSPTLKESCMNTWSSEDAKLLATTLAELHDRMPRSGNNDDIDVAEKDEDAKEDDRETTTTANDNEVKEVEDGSNTVSTNTEEERKETEILKKKASSSKSKPKHNLLKKVVKYAFPVF